MNRNKQIGAGLVGDGGASLERNEGVVLARVNDFRAQPRFKQFAQTASHFEHEIFFFQAVGTDRTGIVATMPRVNYNLADLQPQHPSQRPLSTGRRPSLVNARRRLIFRLAGGQPVRTFLGCRFLGVLHFPIGNFRRGRIGAVIVAGFHDFLDDWLFSFCIRSRRRRCRVLGDYRVLVRFGIVFGVTSLAVNVDDQPVGIGKHKGVIIREAVDLQHHPRTAGRKLCQSNFFQKAIVDIETLADQGGSQFGIAQIKEDPGRAVDPARFKLHVRFHVDRHPRVIRSRPVPQAGHSRQACGARLWKFLFHRRHRPNCVIRGTVRIVFGVLIFLRRWLLYRLARGGDLIRLRLIYLNNGLLSILRQMVMRIAP